MSTPVASLLDVLKHDRIKPFAKDPRQFKVTKDYHNSGIVIRFLPGLDSQPAVTTYHRHTVPHRSRGVSHKYMQPCGVPFGRKCPVCEYDPSLGYTVQCWAANIAIVCDEKHPENNGKTMILEFGVQIAEKLQDVVSEYGLDPCDITDKGCPFMLVTTPKGKGAHYTDSYWCEPEALQDAEMFLKQRHDLRTFPTLPTDEDLVSQFFKFTGNPRK